MPLRLIVGPPNSGRAGEVRRRLVDRAAEEPVLVVPTGDDAAWFERELCARRHARAGDLDPHLRLALPGHRRGARARDGPAAHGATAAGPAAAPPSQPPSWAAFAARPSARGSPLRSTRCSRSSRRRWSIPPSSPSAPPRWRTEPTRPSSRLSTAPTPACASARVEATGARWRTRSWPGCAQAPAPGARRPVFLYGFDDLTLAQRELVAELSKGGDVTVALNYADRRSLAARATLVGELVDEGGEIEDRLEAPERHTRPRVPQPPGLLPVRAGRGPGGAGRWRPPAGVRGRARRGRGDRGRGRAPPRERHGPGRRRGRGAPPRRLGPRAGLGPERLSASRWPSRPRPRSTAPPSGAPSCRCAGPRAPRGTAEDLLAHLRADPTVRAGIARPGRGADPPRRGRQLRRRIRDLGASAPAPLPAPRGGEPGTTPPRAGVGRARGRRGRPPRRGPAGGLG